MLKDRKMLEKEGEAESLGGAPENDVDVKPA